jgi:hypothetical protein
LILDVGRFSIHDDVIVTTSFGRTRRVPPDEIKRNVSINICSHCMVIAIIAIADVVTIAGGTEPTLALGLGTALPAALHPRPNSPDGPTSLIADGGCSPAGNAAPPVLTHQLLLKLVVLIVVLRLGEGRQELPVEDDKAFVFLGLGGWINTINVLNDAGHQICFGYVQLNPLLAGNGSGDSVDVIDAGTEVAHGVGQDLGHGGAVRINGSVEMGEAGLCDGSENEVRQVSFSCIYIHAS